MIAVHTILSSCLLAVPQAVDKPDPSPTVAAQKINVAVKAAPAPAIDAIQSFGHVADALVTKAISKALRHSDSDVQAAAIKALRFNEDKSALAELLKQRKHKKLVGDVLLGPMYYLALGQHADIKALSALASNLRSTRRDDKTLQARVLALGRMRSRTSIETLIKFSLRRGKHNSDARLALAALTGKDLGKSSRAWAKWWADNRRRFKLSPTEKALPERLARTWNEVWQKPGEGSTGKKQDPKQQKPGEEQKPGGGDSDEDSRKRRKRKRRKNR